RRLRPAFFLILGFLFFSEITFSQTSNSATNTLEETILALDAEFWNVYNTCDVDNFKKFLTDDLEFYHDKGGLTETSDTLVTLVKNGLCSDPNTKLRREAIAGSVKVFPLNKYGAIITGEHLFYLTEHNKSERLVESAKFTHVWKNENGTWRMSRVLSYDHQQTSNNSKKSQALSTEAKNALIGTYKAPKTGTVTIYLKNNALHMKAGNMNLELAATSETHLFATTAPIRFEFTKDDDGNVTKFSVIEDEKVVEIAERVE
ncbi:MAG: DUF4440 domain-containing protein, partial [Bacteroidota bacterium]